MPRPLFQLATVPDPLDPNDTLYQVDFTKAVPQSVDLRPYMAPIENQTTVGDCTANGLCGNCEAFMYANGKKLQFAEDFNYYTSRYLLNGNVAPTGDLGSTTGAALLAARTYGVCLETTWPISTDAATFDSQPSSSAYAEAANYKVVNYQRINNPLPTSVPWWNSDYWWYSFLYSIASGYPVNIAFNVGGAINGITGTEVYPAINPTTNPYEGGHDVLVVGYNMPGGDLNTLVLICRNSWGTSWGDAGYFYMSPSVLTGDVMYAYVQRDFAGFTTIGPNTLSTLPVPDQSSTIAQIVQYVYRNKFGRYPAPTGAAFWATAVGNWLVQQIIAGAAPADQAYMVANPVVNAPVFAPTQTVAQVVTAIFNDYFGRVPLTTGEEFWAEAALNYFTTQIVTAAGVNDKAFMAAFNIT
jgi:hypothetical protein